MSCSTTSHDLISPHHLDQHIITVDDHHHTHTHPPLNPHNVEAEGRMSSFVENVYFGEPPRTLYFEKWTGSVVHKCQIIVTVREARAVIDGEPNEKVFPFDADSERMATEFVERLGFVPAEDWKLPPVS